MVSISPTMYIMMTGLAMFFFMSGIATFILLEMGVTNIEQQKRLIHLFLKYPLKVEALIICLSSSFPIFIISLSLMAENSSLLSLIGSIVIGWPFLMYVFHSRMMDFHQLLGIGRKREYNPVFIAKLSILIWSIAVCGLVLSFVLIVFNISIELSYFLLGSCGIAMIFIQFRKSLAIVRNHDAKTDD